MPVESGGHASAADVTSPFELTTTQRVKASAIAATASPLIAALCRTLRWRADGVEHWDAVMASGRPPVLAFWHGRIIGGLDYFRDRGIVVMTSQNFDGEWIGRIIARFGFGTARGSSSRGGARALVQLRRDLKDGRPVAFTVDGPRGPARIVQPGAVWLAGATGHPLLPFHVEAARHWTIGSWDRTQVPKPFSHAAIAIGQPLTVASTEPDAVQDGLAALTNSLEQLERRTLDMLR